MKWPWVRIRIARVKRIPERTRWFPWQSPQPKMRQKKGRSRYGKERKKKENTRDQLQKKVAETKKKIDDTAVVLRIVTLRDVSDFHRNKKETSTKTTNANYITSTEATINSAVQNVISLSRTSVYRCMRSLQQSVCCCCFVFFKNNFSSAGTWPLP